VASCAVKGRPDAEACWWQEKLAEGRGMGRWQDTGLVVKVRSTEERDGDSRLGGVQD